MYRVLVWNKDVIHIPGTRSRMVSDFIVPLRMSYNFKPMTCLFLEVSI
jgi:hypothetical protein